MPEVGVDGQRRLKAARVLCVGAGGLGSPAALYLAAAGVGTLGLVDFDAVDVEQPAAADPLQHRGRRPTEARSRRAIGCTALNPDVNVVHARDGAHVGERARHLSRLRRRRRRRRQFPDALSRQRRVRAPGQAERLRQHLPVRGQASVFATKGGPCYRCLYPEPPPPGLVPSCAEGGVLGVLPGVIGTIQATEAIKLIIGAGSRSPAGCCSSTRCTMRFRELKLQRDPECPVCGDHPTVTSAHRLRAVLRHPPGGVGGAVGCRRSSKRPSRI